MSPELSRTERFLAYIGGDNYPCPIGTAMAREGGLPIVELDPADTEQVRAAKLAESVSHLVQHRLSVLLYPHDHVDMEELCAEHAHVYTPFVNEIYLRDLARLRDQGELLLPQASLRTLTAEQIGRMIDAAYFKNGNIPASPAVDMVHAFGVPLQVDLEASRSALLSAVGELILIEPNVHPVYGDEAIQSIVVAPSFPGARGESTDVRPHHEAGDHGRRCSVTALVTNFIPDIQSAMTTAGGREAAARVQKLSKEHPYYKASHVLMGIERQRSLVVRVTPDLMQRVLPQLQPSSSVKVGRNDRCPCGSGKKFKNCCLRGF